MSSAPSLLPLLTARLAPGVWQVPSLPIDCGRQAATVGWFAMQISIGPSVTKAELLDQIAVAGDFPDTFGRNWDAAADCLQDLSWRPAHGYLMTVANATAFQGGHFRLQTVLLDVLNETIDHWNTRGTPFQVLWESEDVQPAPSHSNDPEVRIANLPDDTTDLGTVTEWPTPNTSNEY